MTHDPDLAVRFDAFAVALQAQVNDLEPLDVDNLVTRTDQLLPGGISSTPLGRAISTFATQYQLAADDPAQLADLGRELGRAVEVDAMPIPPGASRRDING